jgi:predicted DNA-binding mobile mystery protein A
METKGRRERVDRLRELDEAAMAFKVARRAAMKQQGWLRAVRRAVGVPAAEAAGRMGVVRSALYRVEVAEGRGVIELNTLRRAAEALGCELVYGLTPKEGTLEGMAAAIEAARAQRWVEARERKLQRAKDRRLEAKKKRWEGQQRRRLGKWWREYWLKRESDLDAGRIPEGGMPPKGTTFTKTLMQKAVKAALRKEGIRLR